MMPALVDLLINTPDGVINNGNITRVAEVAIRFSTLDAICKALDCKVEDIIEYVE